MNNSGCIIKVPGKLMIAGEYAVLEPGYKAVVVAVNRYVTAEIRPSLVNELSLPQLGLERITWNFDEKGIDFCIKEERLSFVKNAMDTAFHYLKEKGIVLYSFHLHIKSDLNDPVTGKKYGLGSSAAIVVAVISSILSFHGEFNKDEPLYKDRDLNKDIDLNQDVDLNQNGTLNQDEVLHKDGALMNIFKLSAIAHVKTQRNGSGADIAAAVYGGWLKYSTFGSKWLLKELEKDSNLTKLLDIPWPDLLIGRLSPPKELKLLVGWTQESVGTAPMVKKIESFQNENREYYQEFLDESFTSVSALINAFEKGDVKSALESLYHNRKALLGLGELAGVNIETKRIKTLCTIADIFGRGKSSGAGGGDCGIAFIEGEQKYKELCIQWKETGIVPLDLSVPPTGCEIFKL